MNKPIQPLLAENGRTLWHIAVRPSAHPAERHAAQELAAFLQMCTGAVFPIRETDGQTSDNAILIGSHIQLVAIGIVADQARLGDDGFIWDAQDGRIVIVGAAPRGTLNGVYAFLEQYMGCRWFAPGVTRTPRCEQAALPPIQREHIPTFSYRGVGMVVALQDADWAARNRINGDRTPLEKHHGGAITYAQHSHSFVDIAPVEQYFDTHPEYFSEVEGRRISHQPQLCLTNPDVLELAIRSVYSWLQEKPEATMVSVSPNDWLNPCQCEHCRAIDEYEGSHSGTLLRFVNAVAEAIAEDYPQVYISMLAYRYTRKPPRHTKPHRQVSVRLCSIECCFLHPLESCEQVAWPYDVVDRHQPENTFVDDLKGWAQISERVDIWDYTTDFAHYLAPFPNLRVLGPNIRFFAAHGVKGMYEQGNRDSPGGDFAPLKAYMLARLLWDPTLDTDELIAEFVHAYYGESAIAMLAYIRLLHDAAEQSDTHLGILDAPTHDYLTDSLLQQAEALLDEAEQAADDEQVLHRVRMARLPLQFTRLFHMQGKDDNCAQQLEELLAIIEKENITHPSEFFTSDQTREYISQGMTLADIDAYYRGQLMQSLEAMR